MRYLLNISFILCCSVLGAQEQLGLRLENYAGVSSLAINPTGHLTNPLNWDVNLVGAAFFFENNYAFIEGTNTFDLLRNNDDALFFNRREIGQDAEVGDGNYAIDFKQSPKNYYGVVAATIMGPSIAVKINDQHAIGVFTNVRQYASLQNIDNVYGYYQYNDISNFTPTDLPSFIGATVSWKELGLNYAFKLPTADGYLGIGLNLRFLQGLEAAYFQNSTTLNHEKLGEERIAYDQPLARLGFTTSNLNGDNFSLPKNNGSGFATDIGFTYVIEGNADNYQLKLGASIIDLGFIDFNQNAQEHTFQLDTSVIVDYDNFEEFEEVEEFEDAVQQLSEEVYGDPNRSLTSDNFQVILPGAFSLQADYAIQENFYLNALLIQRFPFKGVVAKRGNLFALTPRFEHRWFSASLPISMYNWDTMQIGLAARLAYLVIGTDNLGSFMGKSDYSGSDIYVALKFNLSNIQIGGGNNKSQRRGSKGGKVKCYNF